MDIKNKTSMNIYYSTSLVNQFNNIVTEFKLRNKRLNHLKDFWEEERRGKDAAWNTRHGTIWDVFMIELVDNWNQQRAKLQLNFGQKYVSLGTE